MALVPVLVAVRVGVSCDVEDSSRDGGTEEDAISPKGGIGGASLTLGTTPSVLGIDAGCSCEK